MEFLTPPMAVHYHIGLIFRYGPVENNDMVYWGYYSNSWDSLNPVLAVERVGNALRPGAAPGTFPPNPADLLYTGPVSLLVEKQGPIYYFRHRLDEGESWIDDVSLDSSDVASGLNSAEPVTSVGLIIKTYGGTSSPEITADFDSYCLAIPDVTLPTDEVTDPIEVWTPLVDLGCMKNGDGIDLTWSGDPECVLETVVKVNGEVVKTVPAGETSAHLDPPFPGGSIMTIVIENDFPSQLACTLRDVVEEICDEFTVNPTTTGAVLRTPKAGPTISVDENPGFLRFRIPGGMGIFDNWVWDGSAPDTAATLEWYGMGEQDWEISTRFQFTEPITAPGAGHHFGLLVGWGNGMAEDNTNDVIIWGEYDAPTSLKAERAGSWTALGGVVPHTGLPVSIRIQKAGNQLFMSHRQEDVDPWTQDIAYTIQQPFVLPFANPYSPPAGTPVSRVGLAMKTWSSGLEVIADFDYFCMKVLDSPPIPKITAIPETGFAPLDIDFSSEGSEDPSGGTMTFVWNFGDGGTATGATASHTYTEGGIYTVTLTATDDQNNVGTSSIQVYVSDDPAPFTLEEIRTKGLDGYVLFDDAVPGGYCLGAGGPRIYLQSDNGTFLEKTLTGDFKVTAKITQADLSRSGALAGLMARLSGEANSPNAFMAIEAADDGYRIQHRMNPGGSTGFVVHTADPARGALPAWIGLERQGETFIGSYSTDGVTFRGYERKDIPNLNVADLQVGFAVCSGSETARAVICFELSGFGTGPVKPAKPTGVTAAPGNTQVTVNWSDNTEGDLQGYNLYRSIGGGALAKVNAELLSSSEYTDTGLTNGVEHCYVVRAVNPASESDPSDQVCATPGEGPLFRRGDADGSGKLDLTDAIATLQFLYMGYAAPTCKDAADTDDSGTLDLTDAISSLQFQFMGGEPPASPGPTTCGQDPTPGDEYTECNDSGC
jgi:PKD repeat protein